MWHAVLQYMLLIIVYAKYNLFLCYQFVSIMLSDFQFSPAIVLFYASY